MEKLQNRFWARTQEFFDSRTWCIIKCIFGLAVIIYFLTQAIGRIPSWKGYVGACFWSLCLLMEVADFVSILRGRKKEA